MGCVANVFYGIHPAFLVLSSRSFATLNPIPSPLFVTRSASPEEISPPGAILATGFLCGVMDDAP
ncbi:MAG: hypothetical protein ABW189_06900 [Rickettsiales bacterium]